MPVRFMINFWLILLLQGLPCYYFLLELLVPPKRRGGGESPWSWETVNVNDKPHTVSGCLFCCQAVLGD